jgi:N-acetylneuraminic acid mutarotase
MGNLQSCSKWSLLHALPAIAIAGALLAACGPQPTPVASAFDASKAEALMASAFHMKDSAWLTRAPMPTPRNAFGIATVKGKIYVAGGWGFTGPDQQGVLNVLEVYDVAADTWTPRASMPTARNALAAAAVNGKIYAMGGWTGTEVTAKVERYDPATDTWTEVRPMNAPNVGLSAAVLDGKIYAMGGSTVEVYDPVKDAWTTTLSTNWAPRYWLAAATVKGKLYAVGGAESGDATNLGALYDTVQEYDPAADAWKDRTPLPVADAMLAAAVVDDLLYAVGGASWYEISPFAGLVEAYDPRANRWAMRAPMNLGRNGHGAVAVNGVVYVVGGWDWNGPVAAVEKYAFPSAPITIKGDSCVVWGNDFATPQYVITTDTTELVTQDALGHVVVTCRASGVYNGTGRWVFLDGKAHPDYPCYVWSDVNAWQPFIHDWFEYIAPNGDATLVCWYP